MPVRRWRGGAGEFHARSLVDTATAEVWVFEVERPALVLGSSQPGDSIDEAAVASGGYELVRRRSGGGAVLLEPGDVTWFDAVVPATRLRELGLGDDVAGAMRWFGHRVAEALAAVSIEAAVHDGPMVTTTWSSLICFDGLGPGELVVDTAKLVGISARRSRLGTRFQCAIHHRWRPERLRALLAPPRPELAELRPVAVVAEAIGAAVPAALAAALAPDA